jgi:hypothetical protein
MSGKYDSPAKARLLAANMHTLSRIHNESRYFRACLCEGTTDKGEAK